MGDCRKSPSRGFKERVLFKSLYFLRSRNFGFHKIQIAGTTISVAIIQAIVKTLNKIARCFIGGIEENIRTPKPATTQIALNAIARPVVVKVVTIDSA
jgi:hypothetical protein